MSSAHRPTAGVIVEPVEVSLPVEAAVVSFARATTPAILESSRQPGSCSRFSILAAHAADEFVFDHSSRGCPFQALAKHSALYPRVADVPTEIPFSGGWIGYFTYEAGLTTEGIEPTTIPNLGLPLARFHLYDAAAVYDHYTDQWYVVAVDWPAAVARRRPPAPVRLAALRNRLIRAQDDDVDGPLTTPLTAPPKPSMSRTTYYANVARAKRYIEAGDVYQVNLTQRFTTRTDAQPLDLYRRLRRCNPSSHAAFLPWDGGAILSASPELFLDLRRGKVVTRPIKGTRPRCGDAVSDAAARRALIESEKDRAELRMIIDLLRNDLGRVCSFGTIRVSNAAEIEEHPTVFHQVATIEGNLEPGRTWVDLLRAAFPGGSVTGAPKIRAMRIIDELEPTARGVYCGSIGFVGLDGSMQLNIAIRTMVQTDQVVHLHAGGAIVADSTAPEEFDELMAKAAGMFAALGCQHQPQEVTVP